MPQININTSQNVLISHPAASIGKRILAQLIDFSVMFAYYMLFSKISSFLKIQSTALNIIALLPIVFYSLISEMIFQGQSLGKMALNTRVVKLDGSQATFFNYFIRWIFRIIDIPLYGSVAIITIAVNGKGQRLGDLAAGTTVIDIKAKNDLKTSIYRKLPDDYRLKYPETEKLNEKDIKTIVKVLNHHQKNYNRKTTDMLINTKDAIVKKTGINTDEPPRKFLQNIIYDYNYIVKQSVNNE